METSDIEKEEKNTKNSLVEKDREGSIENEKENFDNLSESKEDMEATPMKRLSDKNNTYNDVMGNKSNGYMKEGGNISDGSKVGEDEIGKLNLDDEMKESQSHTDRVNHAQHGESATPFENGNLDSPTSQSNLKQKRQASAKGTIDANSKETRKFSEKNSKSEVGWAEENKNKRRTEDGKHDEERSLLDPDNGNNLYSKEASKNGDDDKDMRRSSTKPERPRESRDEDRKSHKSENEEGKTKELTECQKKSIAFLDSWQWGIFMTVVTVYTLFFDDIRVILIPKAADDAFYTITVIWFLLFAFEIVFSSIMKPGYWLSFFFWLDILATGSMIFDIGWIMDNVNNASQADSASSLAKSSRAARVTRIVRLVRLIRLVRIVKLYKQAKLAQQKREEAKLKKLREERGHVEEEKSNKALSKKSGMHRRKTSIREAGLYEIEDEDIQLESKISKTLAEKSQRILIVLILTILFLTPMFQVTTYFQPTPAPDFGLDQLMTIYGQYQAGTTTQAVYYDWYTEYVKRMTDYSYPLIELNVKEKGQTYYNTDKSKLRSDEFTVITADYDAEAIYSIKTFTQYESMINIGRTIMVWILLTVSSYIINRDATLLVLDPIERMIERIRIVAKNPMALCSEEDIENEGALAMLQSQQKHKKRKSIKGHENETAFLEASLFTIGRLLGLCFGEAGARIIGNNIASSEIGGDFNPLIPGSKELAIFGFWDIRGFADATEALEDEVIKFVNQVAEIVHSEVDLHQGSSNKNLGEAFLMVWKFPRMDIDSFDDELTIRPDNKYSNNLADLAVLGFLKTVSKINKYSHILEYSRNEKMLERIPNYRVNMGFGLHVGWGIEGAIGSPYKIDASYLSPNVNISARLEAATRQYGVSILISGELQEILNEHFQGITRLIDIVTVKGSAVPMKFYTVNLKLDVLDMEKAPFEGMAPTQKKKMRNEAKKDLKTKLNNEIITTEDLLKEDRDIMKMMKEHKSNDPEFKREYLAAFNKYIAGEWGEAIMIFRKCKEINPEDGPVRTLIHYVESHNWKAPESWGGFRPLTSK